MQKPYDNILQPSGHAEGEFSLSSEVFTDIQPLKTTGSTCEAFSARFENRRVFVKRLKPEYADNPRYRSAFEKEYELGASLNHSSIPLYLRFLNGDTIVMSYVEGATLYEMLRTDDPWLRQDANIEKLVGQLLNVLDYLHASDINHCDIKADNMMVTNRNRNLMLIDLDKAFTDSLDTTPGTPSNFVIKEGEDIGKREMDIRGLRRMVVQISRYAQSKNFKERLSRLKKATENPDATLPGLIAVWNEPTSSSNKFSRQKKYFGVIILIALLVVVWSYLPKEQTVTVQEYELQERPASENKDIIEVLADEPVISEKPDENSSGKISHSNNPDWNNLVKVDLLPLNQLLNQIEEQITEKKISHDSIESIVTDINSAVSAFNSDVIKKYSERFPSLGQDNIMIGIYDSEPVKTMVKRRDEILQQLLKIQQQTHPVKNTVSARNYIVPARNFEKELELDLADYLSVLTQIKIDLDTCEGYPFGITNTKMKIQNLQTDFDRKLLIEYPEKFPYLSAQECHDLAYKTSVVERMVKLRDTVLALIDK